MYNLAYFFEAVMKLSGDLDLSIMDAIKKQIADNDVNELLTLRDAARQLADILEAQATIRFGE